MVKKLLLFLLAVVLIVCIFAGCSGKIPENTAAALPKNTDSKTRTITDSLGRTVEIPDIVERIVPLGNTPRMIVYLGLADKVVGISGFDEQILSPLQAYAYASKDLWAGLPVVGTDTAGATDYYPEEIIKLKPDVIFCSYTAELANEIQSKTIAPVVAVPMGTLFGKDYEQALLLLGDVCGAKDRAEDVINYINDSLHDLDSRTKDIPDAQKPTVLGAAATFKGAHGIEGVYSKYPVFEIINANDVAEGISDISGGVLVDKEQILGWDPQIIFFDYSGVNLVKTDYEQNSNFYAQLTAVKNGNIYQYPNSTYYYSNVEIPIINSYYVASLIYTEQFKDIEFKEKAGEVFEFFLGDKNYLAKLEEFGAGYGKITLGDN
ncbi:MAG: ABC transporter substrate-binding protein [Actinobacteria bacterium]|nr:ABC transporter substrate-binding protein [Actinomycetota bacterium]